jgi:hypothetical protein
MTVSASARSILTCDQYHGSIHSYYLEALVTFGEITGVDPRRLGAGGRAGDDLGIAPATAVALQAVAADQLRGGDAVLR